MSSQHVPFELFNDAADYFFAPIPPTERYIHIFRDVLVPTVIGGQKFADRQPLETIEIKGGRTQVDAVRAHFLRQSPEFNRTFREVKPTPVEKARAEARVSNQKVYESVDTLEVAAEYLKGHGYTDEDLKDRNGKFHRSKFKKVCRNAGVLFPNLFAEHGLQSE